jgi:heme A synthase
LSLALAHNTGAAILLLNVVYINYILLSKVNSNNH